MIGKYLLWFKCCVCNARRPIAFWGSPPYPFYSAGYEKDFTGCAHICRNAECERKAEQEYRKHANAAYPQPQGKS